MAETDDLPRVERAFHTAIVPVLEPRERERLRERTIPTIARSIRQGALHRRKRLRLRWIGGALAAAAAAVILVVHFRIDETPSPRLWEAARAPASRVAKSLAGHALLHRGDAPTESLGKTPDSLAVGDSVETSSDGRAWIQLPDVELVVGPSGRLTIAEPASHGAVRVQRVMLLAGQLDARVDPARGSEPKLVVNTPHVDVVVTGTTFSVRVARDGEQDWTMVSVSEGTVNVVSEGTRRATLGAGSSWSSKPHEELASARTEAPPAAKPALAKAPAAKASTALVSRERRGTLAAENALYQRATDAKNRGDLAAAVGMFHELLRRFPESPLAPEAEIEAARALQKLGRGKAREARAEADVP